MDKFQYQVSSKSFEGLEGTDNKDMSQLPIPSHERVQGTELTGGEETVKRDNRVESRYTRGESHQRELTTGQSSPSMTSDLVSTRSGQSGMGKVDEKSLVKGH